MMRLYDNYFSIYDWLDYFSIKSRHWIFRYWYNNKDTFFDRFAVIGDNRLLIIADKDKKCVYEFKKPEDEVIIQLNMEI